MHVRVVRGGMEGAELVSMLAVRVLHKFQDFVFKKRRFAYIC